MDTDDLLDDELDAPIEANDGNEEPQAASEDPKYRKLQNENVNLRRRLRRTEIEAKHGEDVAALIPDSLPLNEWQGFAEKVVAFRGAQVPETTPDEAPEPPPVERQEREQRLAAVGASRTPGHADRGALSAREIQDLMRTDPAEGIKAAQAKYGSD